ncbi:MAG: sulfatase-like hydrolase/transferase [Patescibacteria group bacterium]
MNNTNFFGGLINQQNLKRLVLFTALFGLFLALGANYARHNTGTDSLVNVSSAGWAPLLKGSYDAPSTPNANDVFVEGNYEYVVTDNNTSGVNPPHEFYVIDVSNPGAPFRVGSVEIGGDVRSVAVSGNYAYLATTLDTRELVVINISSKSNPTIAGWYDADPGEGPNGLAVSVSGTTVYLGTMNNGGAGDNEFYVLNTANPSAITLVDALDVDNDVNDIKIAQNYAYLATSHNTKELLRVNIQNPANVFEAGAYDTPGAADATGVDYRWGRVFLGTANNQSSPDFFVINASSSAPMTLVGSVDLGSNNNKVVAYRDKVYIGTDTDTRGLTIVNVANPQAPQQEYTYKSAGNVLGIYVKAPYTYLATVSSPEVEIVDTEFLMRPNIIFIYTDDQRQDTVQYMPKLQNHLINNGITFTNSFVTIPVCCPSRVGTLTGRYAHNTGVISNVFPDGGARKFAGQDGSTIATWLQSAGYRTGIYGKYLNQYETMCPPAGCYVPPGWDEWHVFREGSAYYNYHLTNNTGPISSYEWHGSSSADYATDVITMKALNFIQTSDGKPFYLSVNYFAPHATPFTPPLVAPRHAASLPNFQPIHGPAWNEEDVSDKPSFYADRETADAPYVPPYTRGEWSDLSQKAVAQSLQAVDDGVAILRSYLSAIGELDDTVLVYTSDNGFMVGEHRRFDGKECPHEECIRVPLIISYPRLIASPRVENRMALNIDLAPTFADLAGITPPSPVDGLSLEPILKNQSPSWRTDFLIELLSPLDSQWEPPFTGVRTTQWKYIQSTSTTSSSTTEEALYDLLNDPYELQSQASNPAYDSIKQTLKARLEVLRGE